MKYLVELRGIHRRLGGEEILRGINLNVERGNFISIIGPSGSGKSSLLYILGLLDKPDIGEVLVEGELITYSDPKKIAFIRNKKFGFIFQFHYLISEFTLFENIMTPILKAGITKEEARERAYFLLEKLGLKGKEKRKPYEISGGEQQRVAIARALANDPPLIIADEPTGNLDSKNTEIVMDIFCRLNSEGKTIVMVTHEVELTAKTNKVIKMLDGMIVEELEKIK